MSTNKQIIKKLTRARRKHRIRSKIAGTAKKPRLTVFRSLSHTYAQLIDDEHGKTLASANDNELKNVKATKVEKAGKVGELIAERAVKIKIDQAIFDKSSYKYHGRVKAVADGARKGGLKF